MKYRSNNFNINDGYSFPGLCFTLWSNEFMRFFAIKPQMYNLYLIYLFLFITPIYYVIKPKISRLKGIYRIGPHNTDVLSIIFGSLLGNAYGEKRLLSIGTRFNFSQEAVHVEYILFLHKLLSDLGYCNSKLPTISTRIGSKGKLIKVVKFST
jgi:hypothetical protein